MVKEVATISHDYFTLHNKVDIIEDAVTNVVKWCKSLISKVDNMADLDA